MAQPTPYTRQADFSDHSANNPDDPQVGTQIDAEFDAVKITLDEILTNLALIQRDDTELANRTVGNVQLKTGTAVGVDPATAWATATAYTTNDLVWQGGKLYIAEEDHTSGTFATDLAANKWSEIIDLADEVPTVAGIMIGSVEEKTSNYTVLEADNGKAFLADTTSGSVQFTLPQISGLTNGNFFRVLLFKKVAGNTMSAVRSGSDTINGETSDSYTAQYSSVLYFSRSGDTDWKKVDLSPAGATSSEATVAKNVTFFKMTC